MTSEPEILEIVRASEIRANGAISKLVKPVRNQLLKPAGNILFDSLLKIGVDQQYAARLKRARSPKDKLMLMQEYVELGEAYTRTPAWLNNAICGIRNIPATIDRRRKPNPLKTTIVDIKTRQPRISQKHICRDLDRRKVELPKQWQVSGNRTWMHAYLDKNVRRRLKPYFSKIKPCME
jgi:hypothetical protein